MAVRLSYFAAVLLLAALDLRCSSSSPPCPKACTCPRAPLLNCSSSGLSSAPQPIQDSITELDLSDNLLSSVAFRQPYSNLRNVWLGNNSIPRLSLCIEKTIKGRRLRLRSAARSGLRCLTWAPALQRLSAERNLLEQLPEGLDAVESLQVLQLSFNRISSLEPGVLNDLHQLRELYLQHNLIAHLHPQMFQNLVQLRVLDLSFNKLTNMQQLTYLAFRNIAADVKLGGNSWHCDCNMRGIRRRMAYDSSRGLQTLSIECVFPSTISGKDLLQLDEEDLKCIRTENNLNRHRDVTVYSGTEIMLSCSAQESEWWTPSGQASVNQHEARLLISDFSEEDTGLYACVSEEDQVLSVFNLQISKTGGARKARGLPRVHSRIGEMSKSPTKSDLTLAVCLSIFFTFLLAFILGVLARPCIDKLWRRVTKKKAPNATHTVTSVQQRHYDNQGFSNAEEPDEIEPHRERRVTFSSVEFTEESNVQYYDTVVNGDQESLRSDEVFEYQEAEVDLHMHPKKKQSDDSSSDDLDVERLRNMKFEHIPDLDELEERRSLSSSSDSSQNALEADQMTKNHTMPKSLQLVENALQTRAVATNKEIPQISLKDRSKFPESSSLPTIKAYQTDSDASQDNEEVFDFSDGAQSPSAKASGVDDSFSSSVQSKTAMKQKRPGEAPEYSSSSDSSDSEPTQTKIKQKTDKKQKNVALISKPATNSSSSSNSESKEKIRYVDVKGRIKSKTKIYDSDGRWPAVDLQHVPRLKRRLNIKALLPSSASSSSNESEDEPRDRVRKKTQDELMMARHPNIAFKVPAAGSDSSSSSDSDDETTHRIVKKKPGKLDVRDLSFQESSPKSNDPVGKWPTINLQDLPHIKRRLDIRAPTVNSDSSSSSDSEDQTSGSVTKKRKEILLMSKHQAKVSPSAIPKPSTDSDSSSSSDSDNERKDNMTQKKQEEMHISKLPINVTTSQKPSNQWPALDLARKTRIKRRLDIKAPTADSDSSSSSDSEDETRGHVIKQNQEELLISKLPVKAPPPAFTKPENRWPAPHLGKATEIKKPVGIKTPSTDSDSSSSSDSDNESKDHMTQKKQEEMHLSKLPSSITTSQKPANQWPTIDLVGNTRIKRRLDIKAPTADSDSSSSSDSEDETRGHVIKQKNLLMSQLPNKVSPSVSPKPENNCPALDLGKTPKIKKPLDIKTPSTDSDSSSSSDSDNESKDHMTQKKQEEMHVSKLPANVTTSQKPANQWPTLDLAGNTRIKRRLDIKAPTADSDSSSSSDSEDETRGHVIKQNQEELLISKLPVKAPQPAFTKLENCWPAPHLGKATEIKKPVGIKTPSTDSDSSSSSDSDNERKDPMTQKKQEEMHISKLPVNVTSQKPQNQWPTIDLARKTRIKRRLDIKAPTADSDSSSSSDSDNERKDHMTQKKQEEMHISKLPINVTTSQKPSNQWPALDLARKTRIKRRLDIKAPTANSDSSSSSDSEDESKDHMTQKKQEEMHLSKLPSSITTSQKPANQWPTIDLVGKTRIKRRLDIKAPTADSDSSSSSDSEDETRGHVIKQENLLMSQLPNKVSPSVSPKPENNCPALDLGKTPKIKKPLDIKTPSTDSDSSSSSDSDNESKDHMTQKKQEEMHISKLPANVTTSQKPANQWPTIDLLGNTRIKRRLDIKAPTADSDSSSSSDSEDETRGHVIKQNQEELLISKLPVKAPQPAFTKPENRWPAPHLGKATEIKKPVGIKTPSTDSDSSSSSDSDNESKDHMTQKKQEEMHISKLPVNATTSQKPSNQWPALDLARKTRIKRRLDIKAPTADSDSSSNSDSEDERKDHMTQKKQEEMHLSKLPGSITTGQKPPNQWPALDFGEKPWIKRRLDIKAPTVGSDSSSGSDSEDETSGHVIKQENLLLSQLPNKVSPTVSPKPENNCPAPDLGKATEIKKPLDIKIPSDSDSSSSSDSDNERQDHMTKQKQEELNIIKYQKTKQTGSQKQGNQWPSLDLWRIPQFKRRLDIKAPTVQHPSSDSSSSSSSEDETRGHVKTPKQEELLTSRNPPDLTQTVSPNPEIRWPALDIGQMPSSKRRLDIKTSFPYQSSLSSNDSVGMTIDPSLKVGDRNLEGVNPPLTREVDNKAPSQLLHLGLNTKYLDLKKSESHLSSRESEEKNRDHIAKIRKDASLTSTTSEKNFIWSQIVPGINIPYRTKTDHDIKLEKYTVFSGDFGDMPTNDTSKTTVEVDPELQSRWSTMNLGVSRFRKHLEITSHVAEYDHNSPPPPDSPFSSSNESGSGRRQKLKKRVVGIQEIAHRDSSPVVKNVSPTLKSPDDKFSFSDIVKQRINKSHSNEKSTRPSQQSSNSSSSSSDTEDETKDHSVTDLSHGVPRIKRYLNIKAPSPEPSNTQPFFTQNENLTKNAVQTTQALTIAGPTDESLITYKRSIFKSLSLPNSSFTPSGGRQTLDSLSQDGSNDKDTSLASKTTPNSSLNDIKRRLRQSRAKTDGDLLEKIKWVGVGHRLPDLSSSKPGGVDVMSTSLQQAPFAESISPSSDSANGTNAINTLQLSKKSDATLMYKYPPLGPEGTSPSSSDILHVHGKSSQKTNETTALGDERERRGLNALKVMSQERRNWEAEGDKDTTLVLNTQDGSIFSPSQAEKDIEVFSQQSQTHSPSASETKREIDLLLLYGVPRYKRHSIGESLTEASLPDPATPQPDD